MDSSRLYEIQRIDLFFIFIFFFTLLRALRWPVVYCCLVTVNGEPIVACHHDEAVNILRNAGDLVMLTVKHYRAATPFLQKSAENEGCKYPHKCI